MNLLVTGGAGFIGANLIRRIIGKAGIARLVNVDCLTYAGHLANLEGVDAPQYIFENVDIRNKGAIAELVRKYEITHVIHLAAESHVDRSIYEPLNFVHTNVVGTFNLLEACRTAWNGSFMGKRFHHVSTDEVYGSLGPNGYFTETTPYAPNSPYSASKAGSDMLVRAYNRTYAMDTVISNCSNNYGPYQFPEKLIPVVIQNVVARKSVPVYGDGMQVRDWLFVEDHADALWEVLTKGRAGEVYNIGGQNEWANIQIVQLICDLVDGFRPELGGNSRRLITFVKDRPGHDRRYAIDPSKIRNELGWTAARNFEQGLRQTIKWYLDHQSWVKEVLNDRSE